MVTDIVPKTAKLSSDGRGVSGLNVAKPQALSGVIPALKSRATAFSASPGSAAPCFLSMYWGSFLLLRGSKGAVLDPPQVLFFAVPELGFRWCLAVSHALPRSCVFGFSRLGRAMFFVYVLGLFSSS